MAALAIVNPKRRGKKRRAANPAAKPKARRTKIKVRRNKSGGATIRVKNPRRRGMARRRRSNPILSGSALTAQLMPALTGAIGAAVLDKGIDMFGDYLPLQMRTGWGRYLALGGITLIVGYGLEKAKLFSPKTRTALIGGGLTVTAYKAVTSELMPMLMPAIGTAPAPTVKGYQAANLMGFQSGKTLADMVNNGMTSGDFAVAGNGSSYV